MSYAGQVNSYAQADKNAQDAALTVCTVDIGQVLSLSRSFTCSFSLSLSLQDMFYTPLRRGVCVCVHADSKLRVSGMISA